jgi:hypothetical protein
MNLASFGNRTIRKRQLPEKQDKQLDAEIPSGRRGKGIDKE